MTVVENWNETLDVPPRTAGGPLIVFAGGGTGGHLYPALAVTDALRRLEPGTRVVFFATDRRIDDDILSAAGPEWLVQPVRPLSAAPWRWPALLKAWRSSLRACRAHFETHQPAMVIGTGAFASVPAVVQASRLGIPTAMLNPDVIPGRANRFLARRVDTIFAQWPESRPHFPSTENVEVLGCPIREVFRCADQADGCGRFGLDPERKTLLATGASLGARAINLAMVRLAPRFAGSRDWQILHLTGRADVDAVRQAYRAAGVDAVCLDYTEHMVDALAAASLVVSRAGASTLAEITAVGRASVLVPYPYHRDEHQMANARVLVSRGAARICRDTKDLERTAEKLAGILDRLMNDGEQLAHMAACAKRIGAANAAADIAQRILDTVCVRART